MSFDILAPHYRWLEFVLAGRKLQRCRTAFLDSVADVRRVLIAGEGNGRFLVECRRRLNGAQITCLDASARMLRLARQRVEGQKLRLTGIEFIHSNLFEWTSPTHPFDLVVTHFFLDCFGPAQLARAVGLLAGLATPDARWLLADFQLPAAGFPRYRAQAIHWLMYAFFRPVTCVSARRLTSPDAALHANGFVLRRRRESEWGLLRTDQWARVASAERTDFGGQVKPEETCVSQPFDLSDSGTTTLGSKLRTPMGK
jgi:ubiquinone/menaquinone biosynthesis C-methylase UbiE